MSIVMLALCVCLLVVGPVPLESLLQSHAPKSEHPPSETSKQSPDNKKYSVIPPDESNKCYVDKDPSRSCTVTSGLIRSKCHCKDTKTGEVLDGHRDQ